jgi:hypothetical protein
VFPELIDANGSLVCKVLSKAVVTVLVLVAIANSDGYDSSTIDRTQPTFSQCDSTRVLSLLPGEGERIAVTGRPLAGEEERESSASSWIS